MNHRHELGEFLNKEGLTGEGAEIGVLHASFSEIIMSKWSGRLLHLIDPWVQQPQEIYSESTNLITNWPEAMSEAINKMAKYENRVQFHRMLSNEAVTLFNDDQLDFVYIDGNHSYEAVKEDLNSWWPKVRKGGLFSGHDADMDGVGKAILEFTMRKSLSFHIIECNSWWIIKT